MKFTDFISIQLLACQAKFLGHGKQEDGDFKFVGPGKIRLVMFLICRRLTKKNINTAFPATSRH